MTLDGTLFINPLTYCEVQVELANEQQEMIMQAVKLGYYRSRITTAFLESVVSLPQEETPADIKDQFYPLFLHLVGWWNVKRGEEMWPLTPLDIEPLDALIIWQLLIGVLKHNKGALPGEATRGSPRPAPSSTISAAAETPAPSQMDGSPSNMTILPSRTSGRRSSPGTGRARQKATTAARSSGARQKSG